MALEVEDYPTILTTVSAQPLPLNLPDVLCSTTEIIAETTMPSVAASVPVNSNKEASQLAIEVTNVHKSYGTTGAEKVLEDFSMKVPTGAIYSLLGSSGCGKTTILSNIVGLRSWDSGKISVLGHEREAINGEVDAALPVKISRRIGYMPQELALYQHLTVKEIIGYFGKLYGMSEPDINIRWKALTKLLELDSKRHVQIQELSGGQKRRVSLALALINSNADDSDDAIFILDEPTVGLDPVLRKSIWIHLKDLVYTNKTTVLITTHYIEETKYSNKIGIVRHGKMLYEEHPDTLLSTYNCNLLQDAILQICRTDHDLRKSSLSCVTTSLPISNNILNRKLSFGFVPTYNTSSDSITMQKYKEIDPDQLSVVSSQSHPDKYYGKEKLIEEEDSSSLNSFYRNAFGYLGCPLGTSWERTLSFSFVMWIFLLRQPIFAFILMFLPALQLFMTFAVVGKEPVNLKVGVINHELVQFPVSSHHRFCSNVTYFKDNTCDLNFLSCPIFSYLAGNGKLDLMPLEEQKTAEELLEQGSIFGYIVFPGNYSENLINRHITGKFATDDETLDGSRLIITLDKSHYLAYHLILKELYDSLENLSKHLDESCGFDHGYNEIPLHFREPVFGRLDGTHQDSIMPAIVAQILFEILYGIAPMILIKDLRQGTFDRASLAGLRFSEFMLGIFVTMCPILITQSVSCYFILEHGLNVGVRGSLSLFIFLCILAGLCGQGFGIFMGILVKSEFAVIVSAIMVIPLIMTCSGTLWPLESHPYYLKVIYYIFPSAPIVSSLRSVINRGVGLTHSLVWPGVLNTSLYSIAFWMLSIYRYKGLSRR